MDPKQHGTAAKNCSLSPDEHFLLLITENGLSICDFTTEKNQEILKYVYPHEIPDVERTNFKILQWINNNTFVFSFKKTELLFFSFEIDSTNTILPSSFTYNSKPVLLSQLTTPVKFKPKILNLHTTILSIFLYDETKIGIFVPNKKVHLINENLEIIQSFNYSSHFNVFEESFQQNSNFVFVKQDHRLFICTKREPFSFNRTIIVQN